MTSILVTGASGLIGRATLSRLSGSGRVFGLVRLAPTQPLPASTTMVVHDLRQPGAPSLPEIPDTIIHMAQSPRYREFPAGALDVFDISVGATQRLLDWASRCHVKRFIYASSGGVYGPGKSAFKEEDLVEATPASRWGHYISCKRCGEIVSEAYRSQMTIIILRFFFVYGPRQRNTMLMANLLESVMHGRQISLQGTDGLRINPIYVDDAAAAVVAAIGLESSETINVAGAEVLTLREIANVIGDMAGRSPRFEIQPVTQRQHLVGCIEKMKRLLGTPLTQMSEGLRRMISVGDNA